MTDRLSLYNGGLRALGERKLASLSENRDARRYMDDAWNGGAVDYCLEAGMWKFATSSVMLDASPSVDPEFGFTYAFDVPSDHRRLVGVWSDENMQRPLKDYRHEGEYFYANQETIYVSYVSNGASYGLNYSAWTQRFVKFVEYHLAVEVCIPLTGDKNKLADVLSLRERYKKEALSTDAMQDPTRTPPLGSWVRARLSGRINRDGQP